MRFRSLLLGAEPRYAARQAALLLAVGALLNVLIGLSAEQPERLLLTAAQLTMAAICLLLPWNRWGPMSPLCIVPVAAATQALVTWRFGGDAQVVPGIGVAGCFVMIAWVALHYRLRILLVMVLPVAASYVLADAGRLPPGRLAVNTLVMTAGSLVVGYLVATSLQWIREMEQWRAAIMAALAHDIRSPLTSVSVSLKMIEEDALDLSTDPGRELLSMAQRQTARIQRLAEGLLDIERISQDGHLALDLKDVPVRDAVQRSVDVSDAHEVVVEVPPTLVVRADPARLEQILINLISNATRYGAPPIVVSARSPADAVQVVVRDHGPGVAESIRDRLFDRFAGSREHAGSVGLGLWISKRLAEAQYGDVSYEQADPGAAFVLTLPSAPPPGARDTTGGTEPYVASGPPSGRHRR